MSSARAFIARNKPDLWGIAALVVAVFIVFIPMLTHMLWGRGFDYPLHLQFVKAYREGTSELIPYPLFHLAVLGVVPLLPSLPFLETYKQAGLIVGIGFYMLTAIVLYAVHIRPALGQCSTYRHAGLAGTITLLLMLVAPVNLLSWGEGHLYWGYFLPNIHMNPTLTALKPFALLVFVYIVGAFSSGEHFRTNSAVLFAGALTVLATLAKPNYTLIMLPVVTLVGGYSALRSQAINWRLLVFGLIVPATVILAVQYLWLNGSSFAGGTMSFSPFEVLNERGIQRIALKFGLSILFPLAVYSGYWQSARRDIALNLAWLIFLVGAFVSYCFVETNRVADGNFIWSGQIALTVLFAASMLFFLRAHREEGGGFTRTAIICAIALALHGLGGVFWYYADMVSPGFVWY